MNKRAVVVAAVLALLSGLASVIGAFAEPRRAAFSYLVAFSFWLTLALGALLVVLITHVTHARWLIVWRRIAELVASSALAFVVLFIPIALAVPALYPWGGALELGEHAAHLVEHRHGFVNTPFFIARGVAYLVVWALLAELLLRLSLREDASPSRATKEKQRTLSAAGIPLFAVTLTLASFDWFMSLNASWASTTFGVYLFAGAFVSSLALLALLGRLADEPAIKSEHFRALGRLTFAMVIFWAYIAYTQFFIVWIADLPEEVAWFKPRIDTAWRGLSVVLFVGHFVLPFFLLLPKWRKGQARYLAGVGVWLLLFHYLDVYWLIMPELLPDGPSAHWLDFTTWLFVGGAVAAVVALRTQKDALVPEGDPNLARALEYVGS